MSTLSENGLNHPTRFKPRRVVEGLTGYKGVAIKATIRVRGRLVHLGSFATAEEAARAYDEAAKRMIGDHAITNQSMGLLP